MRDRTRQHDAHMHWQEFERDDLISQLRIHVYCAYRSTLSPAWKTARSQDAKDRLYYVRSGTGEVCHHGQAFPLRPGGLYLIPAHTPHSHACSDKLELYWCHFTAETRFGTPLFLHLTVPYACHPPPSQNIEALFRSMTRLYKTDSPGAVFRRSGLLLQALAPFIEQADFAPWRLWHQRVTPFLPALDRLERSPSETLSVEELADAAHFSRCYFLSRFKQLFGLSPHRFQLLKRIEQARRRLLHSADTLGQISVELGFADAFHLSRQFKKMTGITPRSLRAKHLSEPGP